MTAPRWAWSAQQANTDIMLATTIARPTSCPTVRIRPMAVRGALQIAGGNDGWMLMVGRWEIRVVDTWMVVLEGGGCVIQSLG